MKTKFYLILLAVLSTLFAKAQKTQLHIIVENEKKEAFSNATAVVYHLPDSVVIIKKVITGDVLVEVNQQNNYLVKVTAAGTIPVLKVVSVKDSALSISITMATKVSNLGNVTVVARKPLLKQEDDKTIVDPEPIANSSTNAFEMLEKIPGVVVDQDGNAYIASTTPATIYINGREMKLSSADLASLLKSLPPGSVSKIELLRNPSAKYDAASSGGIINIVLKKGVKLGTSGSANIAYFQGRYATGTGGVNLNRTSGKLISYLSYQFTGRNNFEELNSTRYIQSDTAVSQKSYTTYPTINNYFSAGIDYAISKKVNIAYDFRFNNNDGKSHASNPIDIFAKQSGLVLGKNGSKINNDNNSTFVANEISSKYKIDTIGSELSTEFDYYYYDYKNKQDYVNYYLQPQRNDITGFGDNKNRKHNFNIQSDLTLKLPAKITLEAGIKFSFSDSRNSAAYTKDTGNGEKFTDLYQTNSYTYKESLGAAYLQASKTVAGFTIKPGLRLETTDISGHQLIPSDTSFSIKRTDLFPYVFIKHNLWKMFGSPLIGSAIYRKSIKRPFYESLNPFPKYIDQYLFDVGNPSLKPQFTTNYEFSATFQGFPVAAIGINDTKDIFSQVTYQNDQTKIAYRTYDNLGKNREFYAKIIGGIPPGKKYFFYVGMLYNHNKYDGFYANQPLHYSRSSFTFFMYHELKVNSTLTCNMQGFMRTKGLQNFYELNTFGGLFVSVNKSLFNKKANIIISVNDLLKTNHVEFNINQGNVKAEGSRYNDTRRLGITLRYNFGGKPKEEKKNNFDAPSEAN